MGVVFDRADFNRVRLRIQSAHRKRKPATTAIASERKIIWIRPEHIAFKISGDHDLRPNDIVGGDWDRKRAVFVETIKYRSIFGHFQEGLRWEDTELFA